MSELEWMKRVEEGESDGVRWVTASAWRVPRDHAGRDISLPPPRSSVNSLQGRRWWRGPMEEEEEEILRPLVSCGPFFPTWDGAH